MKIFFIEIQRYTLVMSRAAVSKSRADKGPKLPASQTPVVSHEIVPGKFNDHDWNVMCDNDGSEDFIEDIVDDLIGVSLDKCFHLYLERQLLPFTVTQAKDYILSIIEWQFLARDEGEANPESDPGWIQDEEPDPAETDCWAQGSVPRMFLPSPEPVIIEEPEPEEQTVEEEEEEKKEEVQQEEEELEDKISVDEEETETEAERLAREQQEKLEQEQEEQRKKRKKFKPYTGRLRSPGLKITESLEQTEMSMLTQEIVASLPPPEEPHTALITMPASCHSILKVQAGRPPGNKDVQYDDYGNVVAVIKLNPDRLPSHRIKVNYQVVDPAVEAAQARLDAMRTGRYVAPKPRQKTVKKKETEEQTVESISSKTSVKAPLPPPLMETMDVAPGVIVKEGGRVKQGQTRYIRRVDTLSQSQKGLRPIATQMSTPRLDVTDILDRHTPILRPMHDNAPLPPIIPHPPEKPRVST